jgi:hypothetical protein
MASGKKRPWAARQKLAEDRDTLLRQYYRNGGNMQDYERIRSITGLLPQEADEAAKRLGLLSTKESR